jgi:hypothetical protein
MEWVGTGTAMHNTSQVWDGNGMGLDWGWYGSGVGSRSGKINNYILYILLTVQCPLLIFSGHWTAILITHYSLLAQLDAVARDQNRFSVHPQVAGVRYRLLIPSPTIKTSKSIGLDLLLLMLKVRDLDPRSRPGPMEPRPGLTPKTSKKDWAWPPPNAKGPRPRSSIATRVHGTTTISFGPKGLNRFGDGPLPK